MNVEIGAIYEGGVLKPDEPLPLVEHQRVSVRVRDDDAVVAPALSDAEFDRDLEALSNGLRLTSLPADFSRGQIYLDHD
jgi:predicted DNA-binding antitoxin AbrB/MazE fold protein